MRVDCESRGRAAFHAQLLVFNLFDLLLAALVLFLFVLYYEQIQQLMRPDSETNDDRRTMDTNGHTVENGRGKMGTINHHDVKQQNGNRPDEKIVLPNEMASMVPLQVLIGKMIRKAHADLMTLTDT